MPFISLPCVTYSPLPFVCCYVSVMCLSCDCRVTLLFHTVMSHYPMPLPCVTCVHCYESLYFVPLLLAVQQVAYNCNTKMRHIKVLLRSRSTSKLHSAVLLSCSTHNTHELTTHVEHEHENQHENQHRHD